MRVVSLLPSATEIVYALGIEPVGVSHECDHPSAAADVPAMNRSHVDASASSAEIDRQVLEAERADGVYEIDLATLKALDPDLVITQGVCEVCAVDSVLVREAIDRLGLDCAVLTTDPHSVEDVFEDVRRIGEATGRAERAAGLVADLRGRVERVEERAAAAAEDGTPGGETAGAAATTEAAGSPATTPETTATAEGRPRVAVLDWIDPVMVAGHWVPGMVERVGGSHGLNGPDEPSRPIEWADVREYDPEVFVVAPCGFDLEQVDENLTDLTDRPGWSDLTAVRAGRAYAIDGHDYLNRPGPRLVDSLEHLAGLVRPDTFERPSPAVVQSLSKRRAESVES
ncbi:cobalamin-binding protein [Halobacteriales archaeon QS_4_69_34]|nr:MAG: cobalamin-binding protein [Halobacteriales archaeon QS_4_69_34]